jgi:hypothetical protein
MYKEMPVIPVNRIVDKKRIMVKNGGPRRRRGTPKNTYLCVLMKPMLYVKHKLFSTSEKLLLNIR